MGVSWVPVVVPSKHFVENTEPNSLMQCQYANNVNNVHFLLQCQCQSLSCSQPVDGKSGGKQSKPFSLVEAFSKSKFVLYPLESMTKRIKRPAGEFHS